MPIDLSEVAVEVVREDAEGLDVVGAVSNQNMTAQVTINWGWFPLIFWLLHVFINLAASEN